ncbi:MAG: LysM peptidoglycan-binding domain-containing protein [Elusimicrobia bacterium]|nr:LysM peptidoglycan-binding domain-containing protein [Elusimicrobiota bacterium]
MKLKPILVCVTAFFLAGRARAQESGKAEEFQNIVVKPGDTLWSIANTYLKDPKRWNELLKYNTLPAADPSIALPGMALKVPVNLIKEQYRAARLLSFVNEVLLRKSGAADWKNVAAQMDLYKNDTLRTRADARAEVRFYTKEILNLYPNSVVILRPPNKNADVELQAGEIYGKGAKVITPSARILPRTRDTEYDARIKEDLTTQVQVRKGRVGVESKGKTVEVKEGFATTVKFDMPPSQPMKLPPMAEFAQGSGPRLAGGSGPQMKLDGNVISLKQTIPGAAAKAPPAPDLAKNLKTGDLNDQSIGAGKIMITAANPVQSYHLQVAQNQNFAAPILDKTYDAFDVINLNELLPPGIYWMRVSYVDLLGFEGKFNPPRQIAVGRRQ